MHQDPKIVLFGPAHSGKSTLAGYLRYQMDPEASEAEISKAQREIESYDRAQDLANLVDISADERRRTQDPHLGTSKRLHVSSFCIRGQTHLNFYTLDTPGAEHSSAHRYRGIMFSDAGAYCIEAEKLLSYNTDFAELDQPLALILNWSIMRPSAPLFIVATKMDIVGWSPENLEGIAKFRQSARDKLGILDVIPISINVHNRVSTNIKDKPVAVEIFRTFYESMERIHISLKESNRTLKRNDCKMLFVANKLQTDHGVGTKLLGKVLNGEIHVSSRSTVAVYQRSNSKGVIATVRKLRSSPDEVEVDELREGELGVVTLGKALDRDEDAIICDTHMAVKRGSIIKLNLMNWALPRNSAIVGREVQLIYLGSRYQCKVADIEFDAGQENSVFLTLFIRSGCAWIADASGVQEGERTFAAAFVRFIETSGDKRAHSRSSQAAALMGGIIVQCGLNAAVGFRDVALDKRVRTKLSERSHLSAVAGILQGMADRRGIEYLIKYWKLLSKGGSFSRGLESGPLYVSIQ